MQVAHANYRIPIFFYDLELDDDYINKSIDIIKEIGDEMNHTTNLKCPMTDYLSFVEHEHFSLLRSEISERAISHPWVGQWKEFYSVVITNMWGAIYNKGHGANPHAHNPSHLSFCYYLKADKNSSPIEFYSERGANVIYKPQKNGLVIFPSLVIHSVPVQEKESERIIISGNLRIDY